MPTSTTAIADLPLPNDYKISLRDQLTVILSGSKDAVFDLNVKLDGTILFPELGSISVAGLTFGEVSNKLSKRIEESYIGVNIDVSIKNLSAKKITIVGAVKTPGTYLVNPFSTISGALAYSGGISEIGTLRDIRLIRANGNEFSFDLYDLLIKGDRSNDISIEAGDTILIKAASQFLEIRGAVRRPAIYEVLSDETLGDIVEFSLGFTETANKSNIAIETLDLNSALVINNTTSNLDFSLNNALSIDVFNFLSKKKSDIEVLGAVEKQGFYSLEDYQTLESLIDDLNFVNEYPWLAVFEQFDTENLIYSTVLFSLKDKETYKDINILPNSKLFFADINSKDFNVSEKSLAKINDFALTINHKGDVYTLPVIGKFSVNSFVELLGLDMSDVNENATYISPLESFILVDDYKDMILTAQKYHNVSFRSPINDLITVNVSGAVEFPGDYTVNANTSLS